MPATTPQTRREAFEEIVNILNKMPECNSFAQVRQHFDDVFRQINDRRGWEYSSEAGSREQSLIFFPFYDESPYWNNGIEIVNSSSHFTMFDRRGGFAIYRKRKKEWFGPLIITNRKDQPIAKLEGVSAVNLLGHLVEADQRIEVLQKRVRELEQEASRVVALDEAKGDRSSPPKRLLRFWTRGV